MFATAKAAAAVAFIVLRMDSVTTRDSRPQSLQDDMFPLKKQLRRPKFSDLFFGKVSINACYIYNISLVIDSLITLKYIHIIWK
jgi:hypothetical protein